MVSGDTYVVAFGCNVLIHCADGPESLPSQVGLDTVLLDVSQKQSDVLSFVHFVEEKEDDEPAPSKFAESDSEDAEEGEDSSSDEEMEF